jgi:phosphonate transport system substrate-binding protein
VLWQTPSLVNNSVMVRNDVPANIADLFKQTLLELAQTPQGQATLAGIETARFHAADDTSYDGVREYIARFEKSVRPVEEK